MARPARRAARRPRVRQRLRLGLARPQRPRVHRRLHRRHAVLLPAGLPPRRRDAAPPRPGAGGVGLVARPLPRAHLPHGRPPAAAPGPARRRAAGRAAPAGRVRRAVAAALPDLHHRDLRPVRLDLQRRRRHRDGRRPGPALPGAAARRAAAARATGGTPGSAAAPPAVPYPSRSARGAGRSSASSVPWWSSPSASPPTRCVRWLVVGTSTEFPVAELAEALVATVGARARRSGRHDARRDAGGLAGRAPPRLGEHRDRAEHLHRQRAARHRRRPGPRRGVAAARAGGSTRPPPCSSRRTSSSSCRAPW